MRMYHESRELREQEERENHLYHSIMRRGKLDEKGYLIEPPSDMTEEEKAYYKKLLRQRGGRIQYTV